MRDYFVILGTPSLMKDLFTFLILALSVAAPVRAESAEAFEQRLFEAVSDEGITVVHLWASWCHNCGNEHKHDGWKTIIEANPEVNFIFVSVWKSDENDVGLLAQYDLGDQPNLRIWRHPNQQGRQGERVSELLGLPVTWMPTTWVFRDSRMRYAVNYGEVRFDMLQQMLADSVKGQW